MSDKILIDTNLWVYLYAHYPERKYRKVRQLVQDNFESIILSPQVLGELYHVLTRKKLCSLEESKKIIIQTVGTFPITGIDSSNVVKALMAFPTVRYRIYPIVKSIGLCESSYRILSPGS